MTDVHSKEVRSNNMKSIRSKDTLIERIVRSYLHKEGFRFRKNVTSLPGSPDIVLKKYNSVIFVNGCFWHAHRGCKLFTVSDSNKDTWDKKIVDNISRDIKIEIELKRLGWEVIVIWECEINSKKRRVDTFKILKEKLLSR
jgi:DNA mismatch endonuclease, patch repair protein